ncbi:MAG TPA: hypothetical protein VFP53_02685 [Sphingomicrobium sp.]|nr:hypothetical protein [Sphingomicrobium sp.]
MRVGKLFGAAALAIGLCACNQGDADNVMAPSANALDPADVNLALGNELPATNDVNAVANEESADTAGETSDAENMDDVENAAD